MIELLSRLSATTNNQAIEPREIFMGLPQKEGRYEYPRDVQTEVWKKWFAVRDEKNCIIKMNTGSGKTVVGLLILQSCLNEGIGPATYVVPDKYLASQVCKEAKKLGIYVTDDRDNYNYSEKKGILVMPIQALVNGKSVFGMRANRNYPLESVLIDDVHACLDTIVTQYTIRISKANELYNKVITVLADKWKSYNQQSYDNVVSFSDPVKSALIPFWIWKECADEVLRILKNKQDKEKCLFPLPLLEDNFAMCNCIITATAIEIAPLGISIDRIKSFANARRRIFMSATLADDSVFISSLGLNENEVKNIITPENASDIGDRLILFPRHLNSTITDQQIREKVMETAKEHNVLVIVPSKERALFWDQSEENTVTRENIEKTVSSIRERKNGLVVFVNRYDGIDLPNDACRMLVIDGLPPLRSEYDKYIQAVDPASSILLRQQVQRIEQGMGRGVRSNIDSCCVVLMGDDLADVLVRNGGISYFSKATAKQYELSKELWGLLKEENDSPTVDDIWELASYSLDRKNEWIQTSKRNLAAVTYNSEPRVDTDSIALRKAYEKACKGDWQGAAREMDVAINSSDLDSTKGYLMQIKAAYINFINQVEAQQIQLKAHNMNCSVLAPISGIQYSKALNNWGQARRICEYAQQNAKKQNDYVIYWDAVSGKLVFSPDAAGFEDALEKVGKFLGFVSTRPDKETNGAGPDNLWAIGDNKYFIIECKSGADKSTKTISKDYCNQLGGSLRWFKSEYGEDPKCYPIMIHPSELVDKLASPVEGMRVITPKHVDKLKKQITGFVTAMVQNGNWLNEEKINELLRQYKLRGQDIIETYTATVKLSYD